jgi:hypothetical protein
VNGLARIPAFEDPPLHCPECPNQLVLERERGHLIARCPFCGWRGDASILLVDRYPTPTTEEDSWHFSGIKPGRA